MEEYLSFLVQASAEGNADLTAAAARWRHAAEKLAGLAVAEAGRAEGHTIEMLSDDLAERSKDFLSSAEVASTYITSVPSLAVVPLGALIVYQRQLNLRYGMDLATRVGNWSLGAPELFDFCLAIDRAQPAVDGLQTNANTFVFSSPSSDARFLGAKLMDSRGIVGYTPPGRPTMAVVLYVGYSVNAINVLEINGRLVLNNGPHRASALCASGATHAIAVVQHLSPNDLGVAPAVQQAPALYLESPRPPMLTDFLDPALTEEISVPHRVRQIRLQFGSEQLDAPG
jgi:hypothetical protein